MQSWCAADPCFPDDRGPAGSTGLSIRPTPHRRDRADWARHGSRTGGAIAIRSGVGRTDDARSAFWLRISPGVEAAGIEPAYRWVNGPLSWLRRKAGYLTYLGYSGRKLDLVEERRKSRLERRQSAANALDVEAARVDIRPDQQSTNGERSQHRVHPGCAHDLVEQLLGNVGLDQDAPALKASSTTACRYSPKKAANHAAEAARSSSGTLSTSEAETATANMPDARTSDETV